MAQIAIALDAHPGVFGTFRIQREEEGFAGTKVGLSLALVIFDVALEPARGAIGAKYLNTKFKFN